MKTQSGLQAWGWSAGKVLALGGLWCAALPLGLSLGLADSMILVRPWWTPAGSTLVFLLGVHLFLVWPLTRSLAPFGHWSPVRRFGLLLGLVALPLGSYLHFEAQGTGRPWALAAHVGAVAYLGVLAYGVSARPWVLSLVVGLGAALPRWWVGDAFWGFRPVVAYGALSEGFAALQVALQGMVLGLATLWALPPRRLSPPTVLYGLLALHLIADWGAPLASALVTGAGEGRAHWTLLGYLWWAWMWRRTPESSALLPWAALTAAGEWALLSLAVRGAEGPVGLLQVGVASVSAVGVTGLAVALARSRLGSVHRLKSPMREKTTPLA